MVGHGLRELPPRPVGARTLDHATYSIPHLAGDCSRTRFLARLTCGAGALEVVLADVAAAAAVLARAGVARVVVVAAVLPGVALVALAPENDRG